MGGRKKKQPSSEDTKQNRFFQFLNYWFGGNEYKSPLVQQFLQILQSFQNLRNKEAYDEIFKCLEDYDSANQKASCNNKPNMNFSQDIFQLTAVICDILENPKEFEAGYPFWIWLVFRMKHYILFVQQNKTLDKFNQLDNLAVKYLIGLATSEPRNYLLLENTKKNNPELVQALMKYLNSADSHLALTPFDFMGEFAILLFKMYCVEKNQKLELWKEFFSQCIVEDQILVNTLCACRESLKPLAAFALPLTIIQFKKGRKQRADMEDLVKIVQCFSFPGVLKSTFFPPMMKLLEFYLDNVKKESKLERIITSTAQLWNSSEGDKGVTALADVVPVFVRHILKFSAWDTIKLFKLIASEFQGSEAIIREVVSDSNVIQGRLILRLTEHGYMLKRELLEKQLLLSVENESSFIDLVSTLARRKDCEPQFLLARIIATLKQIPRQGTGILLTLMTLPLKCCAFQTKLKEIPRQDIIQLYHKATCATDASGLQLRQLHLLEVLQNEEQIFQGENFSDFYLQLCTEVADIMVGTAIQSECQARSDTYITGTGLPWLARTFGYFGNPKWSILKHRISLLAIACFLKVTENVLGIDKYQLRPHPNTSLLFVAGEQLDHPKAGKLLRNLKRQLESMKERFEMTEQKFLAFNFTMEEFVMAEKHRIMINQLLEQLQINSIPFEQIRSATEEIQQNYQQMLRLAKWLQRQNFESSIQLMNVMQNVPQVVTLLDLKTRTQAIIDLIGISEETKKNLLFFIGQGSELFTHIFKLNLESHFQRNLGPDNPQLTAEDVDQIVASSVNFLEKLISGEFALHQLTDVVLRILKKQRKLKNEIEIVKKYLGDTQNMGEEEYARKASTFIHAMQLFEYVTPLKSVINVISQYDVDQHFKKQYQTLSRIHTLLEGSQQSTALKDVDHILEELTSVLPLKPFQLEFFDRVQRAHELLAFFHQDDIRDDKNFNDRIELVTGQLQGQEFAAGVLDDLSISRQLLKPFIGMQLESWEGLINHIQQFFPDERNLRKLDCINSSIENLSRVTLWFSKTSSLSVDAVFPTISSMLKEGRFVSRLKRHPMGELFAAEIPLKNGSTESLKGSDLQDLVRGAIFCSTDNNLTEEQKLAMITFKQVFDAAVGVHKLRLQLESMGHLEYQGIESRMKSFIPQKFQKLRLQLRHELEQWLQDLRATYEACPRLHLLSTKQLFRFMMKIASKEAQPEQLIPYLAACFPEVEPTEIRVDLFQDTLRKAAASKLEGVSKLSSAVQTTLDVEDVAPIQGSLNAFYCECIQKNQLELLQTYFQLSEEPKYILFLWCSFETTPEELENFLQRAILFPSLNFLVIGVDRLSTRGREYLLRFLSNLFQQSRHQETGRIYLLFFCNNGIEMFSFLMKWDLADRLPTESNFKSDLVNHKKYLQQRNIESLVCVEGDAGDGKSHFIQTQMKRMSGAEPITIAVNENFSTATFLRKLDQAKISQHYCIHFNVSAFAPLEEVSKFFFNFIVCGVFADEETGELRFPPPNVKWTIYIEVPNPLQALGGKQQPHNVLLLTAVPLLDLLSEKITVGQHIPLEMNQEFMNVCTFVDLYRLGLLDQLKSSVLEQHKEKLEQENQWNELLKSVLTEYGRKVPPRKVHQSFFLKILAERCSFLEQLYQKNEGLKARKEQHMNFPYSKLFDLFLEEANNFCDKNLRQNWSSYQHSYCCLNREDPFVTILQLGLEKTTIQGCDTLDKSTAENEPAKLRIALAPAFGLTKTDRMLTVLNNAQYILTPDFAIKLLLLNERRKAGQSFILRGDTGVGKTEIIHTYADILNAQNANIPEYILFLRELTEVAFRKVSEAIEAQQQVEKKQDEETADHDVQWLEQLKHRAYFSKGNRCYLKDMDIETYITLIRELCGEDGQYLQSIWEMVQKRSKQLLAEFPLLKPTEQLLERLQGKESLYSVDELHNFLVKFTKLRPAQFFYKILMHEGYTADDLQHEVMRIVKETEDLRKSNPKVQIVVFIDELNTSTVLGVIKEMFMDHSIDGDPLPNGIFWVGAINPYSGEIVDTPAAANEVTGINDTEQPAFIVRQLPPSLDEIILDYANLSRAQEESFLTALFKTKQYEYIDCMKKIILFAQEYVDHQQLKRVHLSIRDLMRTIQLYEFFSDLQNPILCRTELSKGGQHWAALLMAIAISYYFRLPLHHRDGRKLREEFSKELAILALSLNCPLVFRDQLQQQMNYVFGQITIPHGVAKTNALLEHIYCTVVCIEAKIPLIITGPPGCSKTLSFNLVCENMHGKNSESDFFKKLKNVQRFNYQCSEFSTAFDIKSVFVAGEERQSRYEAARVHSERCVIFLDEAGLPTERKHAMKVVHYHLDHPRVAAVILSNKTLDAAKTNRAIQVFQSQTPFEDLLALAKGCLQLENHDPRSNCFAKEVILAKMRGLCLAFSEVNKVISAQWGSIDNPLFHLRDFVYLLRYLRKHGDLETRTYVDFDPKLLQRALERNFNGLPEQKFQQVCKLFFDHVQKELAPPVSFIPPEEKSNILDVLKESLTDHLEDGEDPNHSAFRYVMLIDPTNVQSSIECLFSLKLLDKETTHICTVSDFQEDGTDLVHSQLISEIKYYMELGHTVVLINSGPIRSSFYDVFNKHFSSHFREGKKQYYANVAIGSFSRPCAVHPKFQIIVHLAEKSLQDTPLPFLNRFEKYIISAEHLVTDRIKQLPLLKQSALHQIFFAIKDGTENFVRTLNPSSFYGLVPVETVSSLVTSAVEHTFETGSHSPVIQPAFHVEIGTIKKEEKAAVCDLKQKDYLLTSREYDNSLEMEGYDSVLSKTSYLSSVDPASRIREFIRQTNFHILQTARPEAIYLQRKILPKSYVDEYLIQQEHFSIVRFLHKVFVPSENSQKSKWIVFTRTSAELFRLQTDETLKELLLKPLKIFNPNAGYRDLMTVIAVESISSHSYCKQIVKDFFASTQHILLCVADMRVVTNNQLNFLRKCVDEFSHRNEEQIVVIIAHFPPETLQFLSSYNVIFLNNWDYIYIDALGVSNSLSIQLENTAEAAKLVESSDIRQWLQVAFGMKECVYSSDLASDFSGIFVNAVTLCAEMLTFCRVDPRALKRVPNTKMYYASKPARKNVLMKFFQENPHIVEAVLNYFAIQWTQGLLDRIIEQACKSIERGDSVMSILDIVRSSMSTLMTSLVGTVIAEMSRNFSMETLMTVGNNTEENASDMKRLSSLAISLVKLPMPPDFLHVYDQQDSLPPVSGDITFPAEIPFYDLIAASFSSEWDKAVAISQKSDTDPQKEFAENIRMNKTLLEIENIFLNNDLLRRKFYNDFAARTLGLSTSQVSDIFYQWLFKNCPNDALAIHNLWLFISPAKQHLGYLHWCLSPLSKLNSFPDFSNCLSIRDFLTEIYVHMLKTLWENLQQLLGRDSPEELVSNWLQLFRDFWSRVTSRANLISVVSCPPYFYQLDVMTLFYLMNLHFPPEVFTVATIAMKTVQLTQETYKGLHTLMPLIVAICDCVQDQSILTEFLDDILLYFFIPVQCLPRPTQLDDIPLADPLKDEWKILAAIITKQDSLLGDAAKIWEHLTLPTRFRVLSLFLDSPWRKDFLQALAQSCDVNADYIPEEFRDASGDISFPDLLYMIIVQEMKSHALETMNLEQQDFISANDFKDFPTLSPVISAAVTATRLLQLSSFISNFGGSFDEDVFLRTCKAETLHSLKNLLKSQHNQVFMLKHIQPLKKLLQFLQSEALTSLSLEDWKIVEYNQDQLVFYLFPFMIDDTIPEGKEYATVVQLLQRPEDELIAWLSEQQPDLKERRAKMYMLLYSYYHFFVKGEDCISVGRLAENADFARVTLLTEVERNVLLTFSVRPPEGNDHLSSLFSRKETKQQERHLLVNMLAIVLALPPGSNHLYYRIFDPAALARSERGPGASRNTEKDCGYQTEDAEGKLPPAACFGGSRLYRHAINFMTWGGCALALLLDSEKTEGPIGRMCLEGNFQSEVYSDVGKQETKLDKLKKYILWRPTMHFRWLSGDQSLTENLIQPEFFITQALFLFWKVVHYEKPAESKGIFASSNETTLYEELWRTRAFDVVFQNLDQLMQNYLRKVSESLRQILDARERSLRLTNKISPSYDQFIQALSQVKDEKYRFIQHFVQNRPKIRLVRYMPKLVEFYRWLHEGLAFSFTETETELLSLKEIMESYKARGLFTPPLDWQQFKQIWNEIRETLHELQVCAAARASGEGSIVVIDDETTLSTMLSHEDTQIYDELLKVIKALGEVQEQFLLSATDATGDEILNPKNMLCESTADKFNLSFLPQEEYLTSTLLLPADLSTDQFSRMVASHIIPEQRPLQYKWYRIAQELLRKYVAGKAVFSDNLRIKFTYASRKTDQQQEIQEKAVESELLPTIRKFISLRDSLPHSFSGQPDHQLLKKWKHYFSQKKDNELEELIFFCTQIIFCIKTSSEEINPEDTVGQLAEMNQIDNSSKDKQFVSEYPLKYFRDIGLCVVEKFLEKPYLFSDLGACVSIPLESDVEDELNQSMTAILRSNYKDELLCYYQYIQSIAGLLLNKNNRYTILNGMKISIRQMFQSHIQTMNIPEEILQRILPYSVFGSNYSPYMRLLQRTCGKIQLKLHDLQNSVGIYQELVPQEFLQSQIELEYSFPEQKEEVYSEDTLFKEPEEEMLVEPNLEIEILCSEYAPVHLFQDEENSDSCDEAAPEVEEKVEEGGPRQQKEVVKQKSSPSQTEQKDYREEKSSNLSESFLMVEASLNSGVSTGDSEAVNPTPTPRPSSSPRSPSRNAGNEEISWDDLGIFVNDLEDEGHIDKNLAVQLRRLKRRKNEEFMGIFKEYMTGLKYNRPKQTLLKRFIQEAEEILNDPL